MTQSIPSLAEPVMLEWCRKSAGFTCADVAKKLGREESEITEWEKGNSGPSFSQLRKLADLYKRPVAVFYLESPPTDFNLIRDFRRLPAGQASDFSPELRFLIRSMQIRQAWLAEQLEPNEDSLSFIGSARTTENPVAVGARLRELLGVTVERQRGLLSKDDAFRFWREQCELIGVFTFLSRTVDVEEMRGFALPNPHAPLVVVNGKDTYAGRTFTLMHEMAHLLLGFDGVSDRNVSAKPSNDLQVIEVFCNAVAAEALVPSADFKARIPSFRNDLNP